MTVNPATKDILKRVDDIMTTALCGLEDLVKGPPERKLPGLRNLIVFGRAITNVLQNLRSTEPRFDDWYSRWEQEMANDPLLRYFYQLRTDILKKGLLGVASHMYIAHLSLPQDLQKFGPPPPNAIGFFFGDELGGTGWEVQLPDGSKEKVYVELPSDIGSVSLHFPQSPDRHLGQEIGTSSIEILSTMYIDYLRRVVESAKERFNPS